MNTVSVSQKDIGVAEVFRQFGEKFLNKYPQPAYHHRLIHLIKSCRTAKLGGHMQKCNQCDYEKPMYNSCRSRLCPQCQVLKRERWVRDRKAELLPCSYFHGVFTLPHELNPLTLRNKKLIYKMLFSVVAETLQKFASKSLEGGQLGFISVLHTWNQKLLDHIHLHCIIPAGAFGKAQSKWIPAPNDKFLFPVKAMSIVFKAKFLASLRKNKDKLNFPQNIERPEDLDDFLSSLWDKNWVVYAKRPFSGPKQVIDYLGRYTHKTAISNSRITSMENNKVEFKYRDRTNGNTEKTMKLDAVEFLRRFMLHTLPKGFHRIRHYGFLHHPRKNKNIEAIYKFLGKTRPKSECSENITPKAFFLKKFNIDITLCPKCKKGVLTEKQLSLPP